MPKLCQIIAVVGGKKSATQRDVTELHHDLQKAAMITGIQRTYIPKDSEDGDKLPSESKRVQITADGAVSGAFKAWTLLFDAVLTQDMANCKAASDVRVGDKVVLKKVPVTHLLFLEKQLIDIHTFIEKLPVLDTAMDWEYDSNAGCFKTKAIEQIRTKKLNKPVVLYEATDKHPAQVQLASEDISVGTWSTVHMSGAMSGDKKRAMLARVEQLQEAVKMAREEANATEAPAAEEGKDLFAFINGTL